MNAICFDIQSKITGTTTFVPSDRSLEFYDEFGNKIQVYRRVFEVDGVLFPASNINLNFAYLREVIENIVKSIIEMGYKDLKISNVSAGGDNVHITLLYKQFDQLSRDDIKTILHVASIIEKRLSIFGEEVKVYFY